MDGWMDGPTDEPIRSLYAPVRYSPNHNDQCDTDDRTNANANANANTNLHYTTCAVHNSNSNSNNDDDDDDDDDGIDIVRVVVDMVSFWIVSFRFRPPE